MKALGKADRKATHRAIPAQDEGCLGKHRQLTHPKNITFEN